LPGENAEDPDRSSKAARGGSRARAVDVQLASTSPRRSDLLRAAGLAFCTIEPGAEPDERVGPCDQRALDRALAKVRGAIPARASSAPLLGVDTVVELEGEELGKPRDEAEARRFLARLSGREHRVHTAHALRRVDDPRCRTLVATARVAFSELGDGDLDALVAAGSWRGKAGGYGIQDVCFGPYVRLLDGALDTVIGLHVEAVRALLEGRGELER
jgi:septum formation protein